MKTSWVDHKGKRVFVIDFTECSSGQDAMDLMKQTIELAEKSSTKLLILTIANSRISASKDFSEAAIQLSTNKEIKNVIEKSAIIGMDGLASVFLQGAQIRTGDKSVIPFKTKEEALDWLVS
jgi:hypothetical protein